MSRPCGFDEHQQWWTDGGVCEECGSVAHDAYVRAKALDDAWSVTGDFLAILGQVWAGQEPSKADFSKAADRFNDFFLEPMRRAMAKGSKP